jgi:hypothetical protein
MVKVPVAALAAALAAPGLAPACELSLLFALDVSASVDAREYRQQMDGLAAALRDPAVAEAMLSQPGGVALAAYEWSGRYQQEMVAEWTAIGDGAALAAFADRLTAQKRSHDEFPTAIGYALGFGAGVMADAPPCTRRVIDISGDGIGNEGFPPAAAYREFPFEGVTVNGLAIGGADPEVVAYYRDRIPHGDGAFVEVAETFDDYADAIRRKLLREVLGAQFVSAE